MAEFYRHARQRDGRQSQCKACFAAWRKRNAKNVLANQKRSVARNKTHYAYWVFDWHLRRKFGITAEDWARLFNAQNGCCAICHAHLEFNKSTHVDHCHTTRRVRGLLCVCCNWVIGYAHDSGSTLRTAADYLERPDASACAA